MYKIHYDAEGTVTFISREGKRASITSPGDFILSETPPPDNCRVDLSTKTIVEMPVVAQRPTKSTTQERRENYGRLDEQLSLLYDDIQAGVFGEAAKTGKWASHISKVKAKFPKAKEAK